MENKNIQIGAVVVIVLVLIMGLIIIPIIKQNKAIEAKTLEEARRTLKYNSCTDEAWNSYSTTWENNCATKKLGENCTLPVYIADSLDKTLSDDKDRCVSLYK